MMIALRRLHAGAEAVISFRADNANPCLQALNYLVHVGPQPYRPDPSSLSAAKMIRNCLQPSNAVRKSHPHNPVK